MSRFLITGGSGLIGSALIEALNNTPAHITVLTRDPARARHKLGQAIHFISHLDSYKPEQPIDYVINLAGEPIADKPWTTRQKLLHWQSRVELTQLLVTWIHHQSTPPRALISGSAVGWYGDGGAQLLTENSSFHPEYTHSLCDAWEKAALKAIGKGVRVCLLRTGLVISPEGGFLEKLKTSFKWGLAAQLGDGEQYMPWIHIDDLIKAILMLLNQPQPASQALSGVFNLTAPHPVTNKEFTETLAHLYQRKVRLRVPARLLSLLMGEMSRLLLTGQNAIPARLLEAGFKFKYEQLEQALRDSVESRF